MPHLNHKQIRAGFWLLGASAGAILTYTTRHYINSDALVYMEMGEYLFQGEWKGIINLTFSPVFAVLLGIGQKVLGTTGANELLTLRFINYICFLAAMIGCDLMVRALGRSMNRSYPKEDSPLPWPALSGLIYGFFLIASLTMIRLRLTNPDMLILFWTCLGMAALLGVQRERASILRFIGLGFIVAFGYMTKAFFFMFGPIMPIIGGISSRGFKSGLFRIAVSITVMLALSAPLIIGLSLKKGAFTYGEGGRHIYAVEISGHGDPIYEPEPIVSYPKTLIYDADEPGTRPAAFDVTYWTIGYKPLWRPIEHLSHSLKNIYLLFEQNEWLIVLVACLLAMILTGSFTLSALRPPSPQIRLLACGLWGLALFMLIRVEPRYVAPFMFLIFTGIISGVRYNEESPRQRKFINAAMVFMAVFMAGVLVQSMIDQTHSGLYAVGGKGSYKSRLEEIVKVKEFLLEKGLTKGDIVAVVGNPPLYWARMAGFRALGDVDEEEFLQATKEQRAKSIRALKKAGVKAIVAKNSQMEKLEEEGWTQAPGAKAYYIKTVTP